RDNLPDRGRSGVGAATVHKTERPSQLNENGSLLQQKHRSTRLVPADAGMAPRRNRPGPLARPRPRRRGDGPSFPDSNASFSHSSLQTQRWTVVKELAFQAWTLVLAGAGEDPPEVTENGWAPRESAESPPEFRERV